MISGALYFADKRMKVEDNQFRGFPALWNAAAFYLLLLKPPLAVGSLLMAFLVVLTFVPIRVIHPVRTRRWGSLNMAVIVIWAMLAAFTLWCDFNVPAAVVVALSVIGAYLLFADTVSRLFRGRVHV